MCADEKEMPYRDYFGAKSYKSDYVLILLSEVTNNFHTQHLANYDDFPYL